MGKGGRLLKADNLPPSCAVVTKSGNLNFLEPSGSLRAYNGTALLYSVISLCEAALQFNNVKKFTVFYNYNINL